MSERPFDDRSTRRDRASSSSDFDYSSLETTYERTNDAPRACFFTSFDPRYEQIAQISLEFEKRWTPNRDFSIEEALERVDEEAREELFVRLLDVDVVRGFERGAALDVAEYERRFPNWSKIIQKICGEFANQSVVVNRGRVGRRVENFHIQKILGKGGMGVVYKAFDFQLKRDVALKYLLPRLNENEDGVGDFMNEIKLQARVRSPRVVCAYSVHKDGSYIFLAMEYVDGTDLTRYLNGANEFRAASGPLPFLEAARIIAQVAEALADVHREKIIHRDVKPSNIMIERGGNVRLLDLGVGVYEKDAFHSRANWRAATNVDDSSRAYLSDADDFSDSVDYPDYSTNDMETRTEPSSVKSRIVGTALYMSPEAYSTPDEVDARSDLYSLGGAFFYLLTGRSPVDWFDPIRQSAPTIPFAQFAKQKKISAPKPFLEVLEKLLQPDRRMRYSSAEEARRDLKELIARYSRPFWRRWARPAAYVAAFLVALTPTVYISFAEEMREKQKLDAATALLKTAPSDAFNCLAGLDPDKLSKKERVRYFGLLGDIRAATAQSDDDLRLAIDAYSSLLELRPSDPNGLGDRALLNARLGRFDEARVDVEKAREAAPEDGELKTLDAQLHILKWESTVPQTDAEDVEKTAALNEAIRLLSGEPGEPETAINLYWRARAYLELNEPELAQIDLERSLNREPQFWQSAYFLGKIAFDRLKRVAPESPDWPNEFQKTVDALKNAAVRLPAAADDLEAECYADMSLCYFWNGDYAEAATRCDRVVSLRKETSAVLSRRLQANFLLLVKNQTPIAPVSPERWRKLLDDVEKTLKRSKLSDENRPETLVLAAKICLELGENRRCVDFVNEVCKTRSSIREYYCGDLVLDPLELQAEAERRLNPEPPVLPE